MRQLTAIGMAERTRCLHMGDVVVMPGIPSFPELKAAGVDPLDLMRIQNEYDHHRLTRRGQEPSWFHSRPRVLRRFLRASYILGDGFDPLLLVPQIPFTGVGYGVREHGLIDQAIQAFGLDRLRGIRQLGFLHDPVVRDDESPAYGFMFEHTRFVHSLDVSVLLILMARQNGLSRDHRNLLRVAGLTHDALTPAGGDSVKIVDRAAFDEDTNFRELLEGRDWSGFRERHRISPRQLVRTVQGQDVLGRLLDIADKTAYVARDAHVYLSRYLPNGPAAYPDSGYPAIRRLVARNPYVCGVWADVRVTAGGQVVFTDGKRLEDFLFLRAYLFRELYYHPGARYLEHIVGMLVVKYLYDTGRLTRADLLRMTDLDLERRIEEVAGSRFYSTSHMIGGHEPRLELFRDRASALRREAELNAAGIPLTLVEELAGFTKPGTAMLVRENGRVRTFAEAFPAEAERIRAILEPEHPFRLYYFRNEETQLSPQIIQAIASYRAGREREATLAAGA